MNRKLTEGNPDQWLDRALAEYGNAEPRPGLETRTIANLRSRLARRPWWRTWYHAAWISAATVAVVLFMVVALAKHEKPPVPERMKGSDQELLIGVDRLLNKEVPSALEPALVLTKEMAKNQ